MIVGALGKAVEKDAKESWRRSLATFADAGRLTMTTATLEFDRAGLGKWTDETRFEVTARAARRVRRGDQRPDRRAPRRRRRAARCSRSCRCSSRCSRRRSRSCRSRCSARSCTASRTSASTGRSGPATTLVVRGQDDRLGGAARTARAPASTSSAATRRGELVNEQYVTFFVRRLRRRAQGSASCRPRTGSTRRSAAGDPVADVTQHIDDDQTFRYAPASGDPMPIHTRRGRRAKAPGCPGSSPTASACSRSRRGRCSTEARRRPTSRGSSGSRCGSRSRCCPARTSDTQVWQRRVATAGHVVRLRDRPSATTLVIKDGLAESRTRN